LASSLTNQLKFLAEFGSLIMKHRALLSKFHT